MCTNSGMHLFLVWCLIIDIFNGNDYNKVNELRMGKVIDMSNPIKKIIFDYQLFITDVFIVMKFTSVCFFFLLLLKKFHDEKTVSSRRLCIDL